MHPLNTLELAKKYALNQRRLGLWTLQYNLPRRQTQQQCLFEPESGKLLDCLKALHQNKRER